MIWQASYSKFNVDIDTYNNKGVTFGELAEQKKTGFKRITAKRVNIKKAVEQFQKEARPRSREERSLETVEDDGKE